MDSQLKLQALMDGELSERDTVEVRNWLARDAGAQALLNELQNTTTALAGHEAAIKLPESREFFWSKIEREIQRQSEPARPVVPRVSWLAWLQSRLMPLGGVAVVSCLLAVMAVFSGGHRTQFGEMELASDDMGSYTYRDQQQKMTMVWLYDRGADSQFTDASDVATVLPE